jgi:hypothetical protein
VHWIDLGDGLMACPAHPDQPAFAAHVGCQLPHDIGPKQQSPGEGELACAAAAEHGLPDGFVAESRAWQAWKAACAEESACRTVALRCERQAQKVLDGGCDDADLDEDDERFDPPTDARKWLDVAAKYRMGVAKALDTQSKLIKLGWDPIKTREKRADRERKLRAAGKPSN